MNHNEEMVLDIYDFVKKSFIAGAVPNTFEEFKNNFSTETTDDSLCFSYDFGVNKDDTAMIFFYPTHVAVPTRYQKHLVPEYSDDINLLSLEYLKIGIKYSDNIQYLKELKGILNDRYTILSSINYQRYRIATPEKKVEIEKRQQSFVDKIREVYNELNAKITELTPTANDDSLPSM